MTNFITDMQAKMSPVQFTGVVFFGGVFIACILGFLRRRVSRTLRGEIPGAQGGVRTRPWFFGFLALAGAILGLGFLYDRPEATSSFGSGVTVALALVCTIIAIVGILHFGFVFEPLAKWVAQIPLWIVGVMVLAVCAVMLGAIYDQADNLGKGLTPGCTVGTVVLAISAVVTGIVDLVRKYG